MSNASVSKQDVVRDQAGAAAINPILNPICVVMAYLRDLLEWETQWDNDLNLYLL